MAKPIISRKAAIAYNDIDALAQYVSGFDGSNYFDQQGEVETRQAAQRWPLLARTMGLRLPEDAGAAQAATDTAAPARTPDREP